MSLTSIRMESQRNYSKTGSSPQIMQIKKNSIHEFVGFYYTEEKKKSNRKSGMMYFKKEFSWKYLFYS